MSAQERTERIQVEGPDFRELNNRTAVVNYLTNCLNVILGSESIVGQNGCLAIEVADADGRSAAEVAKWLTVLEPTHTVQNRVVHFCPWQSLEHLHDTSFQPDSGQARSSSQVFYGVGRQRAGRGAGRGRGLWTTTTVGSDPVLSGSTLSSPVTAKRPPDQQPASTYHKRSRVSSYKEGDTTLATDTIYHAPAASGTGFFSYPIDVPFSSHGDNSSANRSSGMGRGAFQSPSKQNWSKVGSAQPGMQQSFEDERDTSGVSSCSPSDSLFVERGPTEGLDVLTIRGLPPNATKDALVTVLQSAIKSAKPGVLCQVDLVRWEHGEARVHLSNIEAVYALWRIRHRLGSALKYDGHTLSWDVTVPELYEDNQILVEGLPADMTVYKLELHISCIDCIGSDVGMQSLFLQDRSRAVVYFDDSIVDSNLVEELNKSGSQYEGTGDAPIVLSYQLIPVSRSVRLSGYEATIDKGALRHYFNRLHQEVKMDRPVLVEHIQTNEDSSALITFRTVDDCSAVLSLSQLPGIGSQRLHPRVERYSKYPQSATLVESLPQDDAALVTNPDMEEEKQPTVVEIVSEEPALLDYIFKKPKDRRRFNSHLGLEEIEWDGSKLTILKPSCSVKNYEAKVYDFTDTYSSKKVRVLDSSLWEKSLNFVEHELKARSSELTLLTCEENLEIQLVGSENEVMPIYQHCANTISAWRTRLEEENAEIREDIFLPSLDHLTLLQRTQSYVDIPDEVTVRKQQTGFKFYLDIRGPNVLVKKTKELLWETLQSVSSISIELDRRIVKFLNAIGLQDLNTLYDDSKINAVATGVEELRVQLLSLPDASDKAKVMTKETYACESVQSADDEQIQTFLRSTKYQEFVTSLCTNMVVMLDPEYDDIRESSETVNLSVVGERSAVGTAARKLEGFLFDTVIFTEHISVEHSGVAKFVADFKGDALGELQERFGSSKAEIDVRVNEELILLRATKSGLIELRKEVRKLVNRVKYDEKELKKHGLVKFLLSNAFDTERAQIQRSKKAVVWVDGRDEDEDDVGFATSRRLAAGSGTSTKLAEYALRSSANKRMVLYTGDICRHRVDVIVNAANEDLNHVGGVAKHIVDCAGKSVQQQCTSYIRDKHKLPTGNAMYTDAGRLTTSKFIIHAVGPRWPYQARDTVAARRVEKDMDDTVKSSLELACRLKCKTIAFPAISTGVFGCPSDFVAKRIVQAASTFLRESEFGTVNQVHIVLLEKDTENIRCFQERMKRDLDPVKSSVPISKPKMAETRRSDFEMTRPVVQSPSFSSFVNFQPTVTIKSADIASENTDVIVNSTNSSINLDSAMASKVIARKAGPGLQAECTAFVNGNGNLSAGGIYTSRGHQLSCQYVIHVNCPNSPQGLSRAVEDCLSEAGRRNARTVSFPALGTGKMGIADDIAAKAMFDGIHKFALQGPSSVATVNLVIFDAPRVPVFQREKAKREMFEDDEVEEMTIPSSSAGYRLSNGTVLSVEQGDVTTDDSDVIVAPTGVVFAHVARKSPQTNNDLSSTYGGSPSSVADLSAGGQLRCRRVYAISVTAKPSAGSDDQCIRTIQPTIDQCLNLANSSGHTSIAIPAIGTGGLGYSNRHSAAAVIEASKAFATRYSAPSLTHIKVCVFDAPRIGDFQQELQTRCTGQSGGGILQKIAKGVRSVGTAVSNLFTAGHLPQRPKRKKRELKSFSAGEADIAPVIVFADSREACQTVHALLQQAVDQYCVSETEPFDKVPEGFDPNELKTLAANSGVALSFDAGAGKEGTSKITLSGFKEDVNAVYKKVLQSLNKALKEEADNATKERILEKARWCWEDDDGSFKVYSDDDTVKLETAREEGTSKVKIKVGSIEYEVDIVKMVQAGSGRRQRKIKREDRFQESEIGIALPTSWFDPGSDYNTHKHKLTASDPEYLSVSQAFTSTGGGGTIVSIERVQNPKLYRSYIQEKQHINKLREKEIQSKRARLEVKGFHGTSAIAVDQIVAGGFNRSYAGTAAGKAYGSGVYFASAASYSSGYSSHDASGVRRMFYCDILLGLFTLGNSSMLEPPVINPHVSVTDKYDSTVDNISNPSIYVSCYRDNRAYPTYLITFR